MLITNLQQLEEFLKTRIPTREALFTGDLGLKRAKHFMRLLGNPQDKLKVIHIAGTSGKGSTCYLMSHMLQSQGFSVGLSISPHIFDLRERMQINNQFPAENLILKYFHEILPIIKKMERQKYGAPTFFEICVGLAYYTFYQEKVDYAVIETGLGGLLDGTNTVSSKNKICILTRLGLDHTQILGKTILAIAQQKAGIIQKNNLVISHHSTVSAKIIRQKCQEQNSQLFFINKKNYSVISATPNETIFNFSFEPASPFNFSANENDSNLEHLTIDFGQVSDEKVNRRTGSILTLKKIKLGLIGFHQAENCSLALTCLAKLSERDKFQLNEVLLRSMLRRIKIPGRMEIRKINNQSIILDGAHNPQKMQIFTSNLAKIFPNQKFDFIVAFKKGKDYQKMLKIILPIADKIFLSCFSTTMDNHCSSVGNQEISAFLKKQKFENFEILKSPTNKLATIIAKPKKTTAITGSLYFLGSIIEK